MGKSNYQGYQPILNPGKFFAGPYGQAWSAALGSVKDYMQQRLQWAVKARFASIAPPDALAALGNERGIIRGASEGNTAYAARVAAAWSAWANAGTPFGMLSQFYAAGYPNTVILSRGNTWSLSATGGFQQPVTQTPNPPPNPYWDIFSVVYPHPFPSAWVFLQVPSQVYHIGSGTGVLSCSNAQSGPNSQLVVNIVAGGAVGTATFKYATDSLGLSFSSTATLAASNVLAGGAAGITLNASGTFTAGDYYFFSQLAPADGGVDSNVFRAIIKLFKPAQAVCQQIVVLQSGKLIGYPARNLGVATDGVIGGCSVVQWAPPT